MRIPLDRTFHEARYPTIRGLGGDGRGAGREPCKQETAAASI